MAFTRSGLLELPRPQLVVDDDGGTSGVFTTADMVYRLDARTLRWLRATRAATEFLGWPLATLREMGFPEIVHPRQREEAGRELTRAIETGEAHGLVYRVRTAQGCWRAIEMNVGVRCGPDLKPLYLRCHVADVTGKVRATRAARRRTRDLARANARLRRINRQLRELKDRYSDLYQQAPVMYLTLDPDGTILQCNDTMLETLGYTRDWLVGRPYGELVPPEVQALFPERHALLLRLGRIEIESRWIKADGSIIDVWIVATAVRNREGEVISTRSVAQDVTARKRLEAELREKNARLARTVEHLSRTNRELDEFTHVVSHDLQEPVRSLISFSEFLAQDCGTELREEGRAHLAQITSSARRMRALISDLLILSRAGRSVGEFAEVDSRGLIERLRITLAGLIRARQAEVHLQEPLPNIWGDRERLHQLFANLVANGIKYNREPVPLVEVGARSEPDESFATFWVKDNGIGIDPEHHARIFDLFRRLHAREDFEGTGAGLAICRKIAQAHGGRIWVESQPGQGATFYVSLPRRSPLPLVGDDVI
jgi:PAS domain S-box-containing protein